jgi:transposase
MTMSEKSVRRKFTQEFREQAVKRVLAGHKAAVVARELDIGESLLHNWLARYRLRNGAAALQAEQAAELTRLKRLLAQREEEVAILTKAAAYFARESR